MDPTRRDTLKRRRREFQARLRRAEGEASVWEEVERLRAAGGEPGLVFDVEELVAWVWARFPRGGGLFSPRVDWAGVEDSRPGPGPEAADDAVSAWLRAHAGAASPETPVVLISGSGDRPAIRVALAALMADPGVVSLQPEAWVLCPAAGWLVEYRRFGEGWHLGVVPTGTTRAGQP